MIPKLPKWCLTNKLPAFYDMESATSVEQTAKIYGAMQGLISDYEKFADEFNKTFEEYVNGLNQDHDCFQNSITKLVHDYIAMLDEKIKMQDKEIAEAVKYMKENLSTSITELLTEMKEMGEIDQAILDSINGIGTRVTTLETELQTINTSLNTLDETDSLHNSRLTTLEINVAELQENETSDNDAIENLTTKTNEIKTEVDDLDIRLIKLETDIPNKPEMDEIVNKIYPVGSIYLTVNSVNPEILIGGTWVEWGSGRVPVGVDSSLPEFDSVEKTGGEMTHTLTISEMPEHDHLNNMKANTPVDWANTEDEDLFPLFVDDTHQTAKTQTTGGSEPHNNLQPYITCYMWKRIG